MEPAYISIGRAKRERRDDCIPREWKLPMPDGDNVLDLPQTCGLFTEEELFITDALDAVGLLEKIHSGELTSLAVVMAFCKRASVAQQALNCLTELFFDQAIDRAKFLDNEFQKTGRPVGPLHGLPVSLKDCFNVAGTDSTIGMTGYAFQPETKNSVMVDVLLRAGAVLYVKTNVPQSMMTPDTENFTFGRTRNPRSKYLTAAGSSGGLGALVAFRGSLVGIGTDAGGSVRIPAYCAGVYGLKPSSGRLPYHGVKGHFFAGAEVTGILCVSGVIAVSLRDCELLLRTISESQPWLEDPSCSFLPWKPMDPIRLPLVVGVISDEPATTLLPPVRRVLEETANCVRMAGHEVIELEFHKCAELNQVALNFAKIDGGRALDEIRNRTGEPYTESVLQGGYYPCEPGELIDLYCFSAERACLQHEWLRFWADTAKRSKHSRPIDVILCPAQSCLPRPHETLIRSCFSRNWNVLDYPSVLIQCGRVDLTRDDTPLPRAKGPADERVQSTYTKEKRERYADFPVGLQLVGRRQMEPELMKIAELVQDLVRENVSPY